MLTPEAPQAESLWDEVLPIEARVLPEDLAKLNRLVSDPGLLRAIADTGAARWQTGSAVLSDGRPRIADGDLCTPDGDQAAASFPFSASVSRSVGHAIFRQREPDK